MLISNANHFRNDRSGRPAAPRRHPHGAAAAAGGRWVAVSPSLTAALATIGRHGPLTPSELAARERIQRPTATRLLASLEAGGLVQRTADPGDGRSSLLTVTPEGSALLTKLRTRKDAYLAQRLRTLDAEERATLARASELLERLLEDEA